MKHKDYKLLFISVLNNKYLFIKISNTLFKINIENGDIIFVAEKIEYNVSLSKFWSVHGVCKIYDKHV